MNKDEILKMEAGREMDAWIDQYIMTDEPPGFWLWSTDISAMWLVVEKSSSFMIENRQTYRPNEWSCEIAFDGYIHEASADTPSLAICRAALLAVLDI